jgi:hypothetical protein
MQIVSGVNTDPNPNGTTVCFPEVQRPEREAINSSPSQELYANGANPSLLKSGTSFVFHFTFTTFHQMHALYDF